MAGRDEEEALAPDALVLRQGGDHELVAVGVIALAEERNPRRAAEVVPTCGDRDSDVLQADLLVPCCQVDPFARFGD